MDSLGEPERIRSTMPEVVLPDQAHGHPGRSGATWKPASGAHMQPGIPDGSNRT